MNARNSKAKGLFYTVFVILLVTGITVFLKTFEVEFETHKKADTPAVYDTDMGQLKLINDRQQFWVKIGGQTFVVQLERM